MKFTKSIITNIRKFLNTIPYLQIGFALLSISLLMFVPNDPDFFWHLKYGELTLKQGPISHNPFSYTFSDYKFYDYQWLSHVLIYSIHKIGGNILLAAVYGLIVFVSVYLSINNPICHMASKKVKNILLFFSLVILSPIIGIRPQMISILGVSVTFFILIKYLKYKSKLIYILPFVTLIWVNSHPGFLAGIVLQILFLSIETLKRILRKIEILDKVDSIYKKQPSIKPMLFVSLVSIISTIITPFGINILIQSVKFSFDSYAAEHISEWLPPSFISISGIFAILYLIIIIISFFKRNNTNLLSVSIGIIFGYMCLSAIRHLPLFVILTIPLIATAKYWKYIKYLDSKIFILQITKTLFTLTATIIFLCNTLNFIILNTNNSLLYKRSKFPYKAVRFLKDKKFEGNIFNKYGWGGFLIQTYPEKKVFIDGRMTSWKISNRQILVIYREISNLNKSDWREQLNRYNIRIVLLDKQTPLANALSTLENWEKVYEDDMSIILAKKSN